MRLPIQELSCRFDPAGITSPAEDFNHLSFGLFYQLLLDPTCPSILTVRRSRPEVNSVALASWYRLQMGQHTLPVEQDGASDSDHHHTR
jgi:hypothetical protein